MTVNAAPLSSWICQSEPLRVTSLDLVICLRWFRNSQMIQHPFFLANWDKELKNAVLKCLFLRCKPVLHLQTWVWKFLRNSDQVTQVSDRLFSQLWTKKDHLFLSFFPFFKVFSETSRSSMFPLICIIKEFVTLFLSWSIKLKWSIIFWSSCVEYIKSISSDLQGSLDPVPNRAF